MSAQLQYNAVAAMREHIEELEETVRQLREQLVPSASFASAGHTASSIAKQVDLPLPIVKSVLKGD